jgi:hypothetical protein
VLSVAEHCCHAEDPPDNLAGAMPGHDRLPIALPRVSHLGGDVSSPTGPWVGILLPAGIVRALCQVITYIGLSSTCIAPSNHESVVLQASTLIMPSSDRLCGLVVRVSGYRSRGSGSIPGATRFSEK